MSNSTSENGLVAIAADHAGFGLKESIKAALFELGVEYEDLGTDSSASTDYPPFAHAVAEGVVDGRYWRGILVCGTGLGMCMAANRHRGVRAAVCTGLFTARMSRSHNDANILCVGANVVGAGLAKEIVRTFLDTSFEGGRHIPRIAKIELE